MIAWNHADIVRLAQSAKPITCANELIRQSDVDEIAHNGDMIRRMLLQVVDEDTEHGFVVKPVAVEPVGQIALYAFAQELGSGHARWQRKMRICEVSKSEHRYGRAVELAAGMKAPARRVKVVRQILVAVSTS